VQVTGVGALLDTNGNPLSIGDNLGSIGELTVAQAGTIVVGSPNSGAFSGLSIANGSGGGGTGKVTVTDVGSTLTSNGYVLIGRGGTASLTIKNGACFLVNDSLFNGSGIGIGAGRDAGPVSIANVGGNGTATVTSGGRLTLNSTTSIIRVGGNGVTGTLNVDDGGTVLTTNGITVGTATEVNGTVYGGTGRLNIGIGGTVEVTVPTSPTAGFGVSIGNANPSISGPNTVASGVAMVNGAASRLATNSGIAVGLNGTGSLTVSQGGSVVSNGLNSSSALSIAKRGAGAVTITGPGSTFLANGGVYVGRAGRGTLTVENQGSLLMNLDTTANADLTIGGAGKDGDGKLYLGGNGAASVTSGGLVTTQGRMFVGLFGTNGTLTVTDGGTVNTATLLKIGNSMSIPAGTPLVSTSGTTIAASDTIVSAAGTVNIGPGGTLRAAGGGLSGAADIIVGAGAGSTGTLNVGGVNALVSSNSGKIAIGDAGSGTLNMTAGAVVDAGTGEVDISSLGTVVGVGLIEANIVNNGGIFASNAITPAASTGGLLEITGSVTGSVQSPSPLAARSRLMAPSIVDSR
jgi:T5SS/PEP-CTERM-associated repeat protein